MKNIVKKYLDQLVYELNQYLNKGSSISSTIFEIPNKTIFLLEVTDRSNQWHDEYENIQDYHAKLKELLIYNYDQFAEDLYTDEVDASIFLAGESIILILDNVKLTEETAIEHAKVILYNIHYKPSLIEKLWNKVKDFNFWG